MNDLFVPNYGGAEFWEAESTVFGVWIGINDVGNSFWSGEEENAVLYGQIFIIYKGLVEELYESGARNFVLLNVPSIQRSPLTLGQGAQAIELETAALEMFNGMVEGLAGDLKAEHDGVNVWLYDSYAAFDEVLDDPASHPQTEGYKDVTTFCEEYEK